MTIIDYKGQQSKMASYGHSSRGRGKWSEGAGLIKKDKVKNKSSDRFGTHPLDTSNTFEKHTQPWKKTPGFSLGCEAPTILDHGDQPAINRWSTID